MANKTTGQWVGAIVGAVVGFFVGDSYDGAMLGAAIGGAAGGAIDPPKGPKIVGPRLSDLSVQTSTYGAAIPRVYGSCAFFGNIFWLENNQLKEVEKNEGGGKGGGGGAETTTYSYYATFALGLCRGPIAGVRRIWAGSKLIYDAGSDEIGAIMASNRTAAGFRLYLGDEDQLPDPRMQAALGIANTPAYRGLAYLVFDDFALADYGNSLLGCPFKVELLSAMTSEQYARLTYVTDNLIPRWDSAGGTDRYGPFYPEISGGVFSFEHGNRRYGVSADGRLLYTQLPEALGATLGHIGLLNGVAVAYIGTGGSGGFGLGYLSLGGIAVLSRVGTSNYEFQGCAINADGDRAYVFVTIGGVDYLNIYDEDFALLSSQPQTVRPFPIGTIYYPAIPGNSETFCVENNGSWMWHADAYTGQVHVWSISDSGVLSHVHTFVSATTPFMGPYGVMLAIAAQDGLCCGAGNGGNFFCFNRAKIVTGETVALANIVSAECLASGLLAAADIDVSALTSDVRGYKVTAVAAIRSALEPLQAAWPFDAIQDGYRIRFVPRGNASVASITLAELGAVVSGEKPEIRIKHAREMDTQLPRRVQVTYFDQGREYDTGEQAADRLSTEAVGLLQVELPIVMMAPEAAGVAETLLYLYWLERHDVDFVLPPTYARLQPSDVVTVSGSGVSYILRLTAIHYLPDGRLECSAKFNDTAIYTPAALGEEPLVSGPVLTFAGHSALQLLDIPAINSIMDQPGLLAAASGYYPGWRGGTVFRSDDGGQIWQGVQGFTAPGAVAGNALNSIGIGRTDLIDASSRLNVRLYSGALSSVSELTMCNGANHFAYGAHGRWEIIAAQYAVEESDGTWTLSNLLRGRFGTEQYMNDHNALDAVVLLDSSALHFIGLSVSAINATRLWKAVSAGDSLDYAAAVPMAYSGVNLECLPPCDVRGWQAASGDWSIVWTRRSRIPVEAFSGVVTPLGESSEAYQLEVWDNTFSTLKRTIAGLASPAATYTSAQQVADFGASRNSFGVRIYQLSATVGRGYVAQTMIDRFANEDGYWDQVSVMLRLGAEDGIVDAKGNALTVGGNIGIVTTPGDPWGSAIGQLYCDGAGTADHVSLVAHEPTNFGTADFTIDFWVNLDATPPNGYPFVLGTSSWSAASPNHGVYITAGGAGTLYGGTGNISLSPASTLSGGFGVASTSVVRGAGWKFVEFNREGKLLRCFVGGILESFVIGGIVMNLPGENLVLFNNGVAASGRQDKGALRDVRITPGVVRHRSNYTPPLQPQPTK